MIIEKRLNQLNDTSKVNIVGEQMTYYEIIVTTRVKKDMKYDEANQIIGGFINRSFYFDEKLASIHEKTGFKYYIFSTLTPIEKEKTYHKNRLYTFRIRGLEEELITTLKSCLEKTGNPYLEMLTGETKKVIIRKINRLKTVNPVVVTLDGGPAFTHENNINHIIKRIQSNLEKKYNSFYNTELRSDNLFITGFKILNQKPIAMKYKDIKLLGNKFEFFISEDEISQKLANMALATGIGEKNTSLGAGFCVGVK